MRRAGPMGALLLTAAAVAGCGSGSSGPSTTAARTASTASHSKTVTASGTLSHRPHHRTHHATPKAPKGPKGPKVGHAQQVDAGDSHLTVTVTHIIDPLTHCGSPALAGTRQVGVEIELVNRGPATYDSTASGDVSVVLSSGEGAPLDVRAGPCETQLVDFESHVYSGDTREGCVGFSIPRHAKVLAARFSAYSHNAGTLTWTR